MTIDSDLRRLERALADDLTDLAAEVARLTLLRRSGTLSWKRIWRAAQLGDPAAKEVHGKKVREKSHSSSLVFAEMSNDEWLDLAVKWIIRQPWCETDVVGGAEAIRKWAAAPCVVYDREGLTHKTAYPKTITKTGYCPWECLLTKTFYMRTTTEPKRGTKISRIYHYAARSPEDVIAQNADIVSTLLMRKTS